LPIRDILINLGVAEKQKEKLLLKELGPVEAIRFVNIPKKRRMESVKRYREWQKHLDKEKFFAEVFRNSKP